MKNIFSIIMIFTLCCGIPFNTFASYDNIPMEIGAIMVNNETGESIPIDIEISLLPQDRAFSGEENSNQDVTAKATFKIPAEINPRFTDTSTTTTDVTASISINYGRQGDKIRVNKVYGSWKPATSMIEISKREVHYGDGVPLGGKSDHKYPTSNSFSYTTGWGWVDWYPASSDAMSGARAFSSAVVSVPGMSGSHTIEVFVTANQ